MSAAKRARLTDTDERKFVLKHVFTNFHSLREEEERKSDMQYHYNIGWNLSLHKSGDDLIVFLNCPKIAENDDYKIETILEPKTGKTFSKTLFTSKKFDFEPESDDVIIDIIHTNDDMNNYHEKELTVECQVTILKMIGVKKNLREFDESNKEFSDVVLVVEKQKFHVNKMFLASQSSYFKALLCGNFDESKQSEVELKDINPENFQNFLELIHGESSVDDNTIDGILKLADFFDSKTAMRRCEEFLQKSSDKSLKLKFDLANRYKMSKFLEKMVSEMQCGMEIRSVLPRDMDTLEPKIVNKLLFKALTFCNN